ncbi:cyclin-dependent kinases regulatory subunit 2-like isoform X2 [Gambusia affinis]|uniref:cyclin-dependent kinases regulatory subunit 2-like isoform X2 n=1 Tax=Gambusia affinis TaxID=33528 RepID=UPI001CDD3588|nr:cyclin-dependent kinases regulatory subunit 2-like isoform X2 [Gambusia affinis]
MEEQQSPSWEDTVLHVVLPREMAKHVPKSHLMSEDEWRQLGVQQSKGWIHYMIHEPVSEEWSSWTERPVHNQNELVLTQSCGHHSFPADKRAEIIKKQSEKIND